MKQTNSKILKHSFVDFIRSIRSSPSLKRKLNINDFDLIPLKIVLRIMKRDVSGHYKLLKRKNLKAEKTIGLKSFVKYIRNLKLFIEEEELDECVLEYLNSKTQGNSYLYFILNIIADNLDGEIISLTKLEYILYDNVHLTSSFVLSEGRMDGNSFLNFDYSFLKSSVSDFHEENVSISSVTLEELKDEIHLFTVEYLKDNEYFQCSDFVFNVIWESYCIFSDENNYRSMSIPKLSEELGYHKDQLSKILKNQISFHKSIAKKIFNRFSYNSEYLKEYLDFYINFKAPTKLIPIERIPNLNLQRINKSSINNKLKQHIYYVYKHKGRLPSNLLVNYDSRFSEQCSNFPKGKLTNLNPSIKKNLYKKIKQYYLEESMPNFIEKLVEYSKNRYYKKYHIKRTNNSAEHIYVLEIILQNVDNTIATEITFITTDYRNYKRYGYVKSCLLGNPDIISEENIILYISDYKPALYPDIAKYRPLWKNFINAIPQICAYAKIIQKEFNIYNIMCVIFNKHGAWLFPSDTLDFITEFLHKIGLNIQNWEYYF